MKNTLPHVKDMLNPEVRTSHPEPPQREVWNKQDQSFVPLHLLPGIGAQQNLEFK